MPDLWPDEFGESKLVPPLIILKEQAAAITARTRQRLVGSVRQVVNSYREKGSFFYNFELTAPILEDYTYTLFYITHDILLYPLLVSGFDGGGNQMKKCGNPAEFMTALKEILSSDKTKQLISALLAQVDAMSEAKQPA